jgi:putative hydrolase of the HAD superfamily
MSEWLIALDADDTLWHNERYFMGVTERFVAMCSSYAPGRDLEQRLAAIERKNLELFGYGAKGFTLSLIETAIEVTDGAVSTADIQRCIDWGRWILAHPVEVLDGVAEAVEALAARYRVILITKGDLLHQEAKVAASGLAERFEAVHVVNEKDPDTYRRILTRHGGTPERFVMVGNSVRSDVLPVVDLGGHAVHIPYELTWIHELVEHDGGFAVLSSIRELPDYLATLTAG